MRGMNATLILKEKTDKKVIYNYSADTSAFKGGKVIVDGEIECMFDPEESKTLEYKTLKTATFDDDGGQAEWICHSHIWRTIFKENCPKKRFIATG